MSERKVKQPRVKQQESQQLHNGISQIAAIRLQAELLLLQLAAHESMDRSDTQDSLQRIVDLTVDAQETLGRLLVKAQGGC